MPWLFAACRTREVDFVWRLAVERVVRAVFIVPIDDERRLLLVFRLLFRNRRQSQDILERSVKSFDHGDATMFADGAEARQDTMLLAPAFLEVVALKFAPLVDNEMLRLRQSLFDNPVQCCRNFLRRGPILEHCEAHSST